MTQWHQIKLGIGNDVYQAIRALRQKQQDESDDETPFYIWLERTSGNSVLFFKPEQWELAKAMDAEPCDTPSEERFLKLQPIPWGHGVDIDAKKAKSYE